MSRYVHERCISAVGFKASYGRCGLPHRLAAAQSAALILRSVSLHCSEPYRYPSKGGDDLRACRFVVFYYLEILDVVPESLKHEFREARLIVFEA